MRTRAVGAVLGMVLGVVVVAGCSSGEEIDVDLPAAGDRTSCTSAVSVAVGPAVPVLLAGQATSLPPDASLDRTETLDLDDEDVPVEVVGATGPVDDELRAAITDAAGESSDGGDALLSLDPLPATQDVPVDLANPTEQQQRWATYVVTRRLSGTWEAEGCGDEPQRGEVRGWDGDLVSGTIACSRALRPPTSPRLEADLRRLVTTEICRG